MSLHPVSVKIDDDMFAWLKERVKVNGTSQSVEIEKCLRYFMDDKDKWSDQARDADAVGPEVIDRIERELYETPVTDRMSPRDAWYSRHNLKAQNSKSKPLKDFAQLATKYPAFGEDE